VGLPREVGAAALGRGSATITRDESPFFGVWFFAWESGKHRGRGVDPWQEVGAALLELGNDDCRGLLLRTRLFLASLGVWGRPWGVGAAGCYATMLGNDDPGLLCVLCCVAWVG